MNEEYNNNFLSYDGKINRKNYAINMAILSVLGLLLSISDFSALFEYSRIPILFTVFNFMTDIGFFLICGCILSVTYRRINDISENRTKKFKDTMMTLYTIFLCVPFIYLFLGDILNIAVLHLIIYGFICPLSLIFCIIIGVIKSKKK